MAALKHQPALDGVRALAVVGVIFTHTRTLLPGGGRGVDVFFVLSGYLITTILMAKPEGFLLRRARRLVPALVVFLAAYVVAAPFVFPADNSIREALLALFYVSNWSMAFDFRESGLAHIWSLAVEAQFYLLWPLILAQVRKSNAPALWLGGAWIILTVTRNLIPDQVFAYYAMPIHATGLIVGAAVAMRPPPPHFGWLGLGMIGLAFKYGGGFNSWGLPVSEIGTGLLIPALFAPSFLTTAFAWKPVAWLGLISYGVYLWHWPIALLTRDYWWSFPVTFTAAVALAALSYYAVEQRFKKHR